MPLIEWTPEFDLGIPKIDAHHRYMIGLINGLAEHIQSGDHQTFIIGILEELYSSAAKQFAHEEAIMRESGYDQYEKHEADHRRLLDRVTVYISDYHTARSDDGMAKWLATWFCDHHQSHDSRLHRSNAAPTE